MQRPAKSEHSEYYGKYISLIPDAEGLAVLRSQLTTLPALFASLTEEQGLHRYAPDKWTIKESISHLLDGERIFAYRLLRISRGDQTPLPGFEQDVYIENSDANNRTFASLLEEFDAQRRSNLLMIESISPERLLWQGTASDAVVSVRALIYIMAGHVRHHEQLFREKYGLR